jgi:hypothetical protein
LIVCEDITERKRAAEALREVEMELAHANRVATMGSCRLRSPMKSISPSQRRSLTPMPLCAGWAPDRRIWRRFGKGSVASSRTAIGPATVIGRIRALINKAPPRKDALAINEVIREVIELTRGEAVKNAVGGSACRRGYGVLRTGKAAPHLRLASRARG